MKGASGKAGKAEWHYAIQADGRSQFAVLGNGLEVQPRSGNSKFILLDVEQTLPFSIKCAGYECKPRLIVKVLAKPNQRTVRRIREGQLRDLGK